MVSRDSSKYKELRNWVSEEDHQLLDLKHLIIFPYFNSKDGVAIHQLDHYRVMQFSSNLVPFFNHQVVDLEQFYQYTYLREI